MQGLGERKSRGQKGSCLWEGAQDRDMTSQDELKEVGGGPAPALTSHEPAPQWPGGGLGNPTDLLQGGLARWAGPPPSPARMGPLSPFPLMLFHEMASKVWDQPQIKSQRMGQR